MTAIMPASRSATAGEPKPIIPPLAGFYSHARDLSWLVVRLTAGGMLLVHGIMKVMPMAEKGFIATIEAFATGSMARRGIEPAPAECPGGRHGCLERLPARSDAGSPAPRRPFPQRKPPRLFGLWTDRRPRID